MSHRPHGGLLHKAHIQTIVGLSPGRPVFRLMWNDNAPTAADKPFILKGDPGSKESLSSTYGLMRDTARGVRWRVLDATETRWLFEAAAAGKADATAQGTSPGCSRRTRPG